jgi:hypothetical protein
MDNIQHIIFGVAGQEIELYPRQGRADAAATVQVWYGEYSLDQDPVLEPTATLDSVDLVVDADSGYAQTNRRKINLATTTGVVIDRQYIVTNASGQDELVRVKKIVTDDYVEVEQDLAYDYVGNNAAFRGFRQVWTVDSSWASNLQYLSGGSVSQISQPTDTTQNRGAVPYKVLWSFNVGGKPVRHWTYFHLVRAAFQHNVTAQDLYYLRPDLAYQSLIGQDGEGWERVIIEAARRVQRDLEADGIPSSTIAEGPLLDELVRLSALMLAAKAGAVAPGRDAEAGIRDAVREYLTAKERYSGKMRRSDSADGSIGPGVRQIWFRS